MAQLAHREKNGEKPEKGGKNKRKRLLVGGEREKGAAMNSPVPGQGRDKTKEGAGGAKTKGTREGKDMGQKLQVPGGE